MDNTTYLEELNARSLGIHRRKHQLIEKYKELVKTHAAKRTRINPSLALEIVALRCDVVDEKESHRKVFEENEGVQAEGKVLREELEWRQANLVQQRRAEAVMIEQQQRLMLERQREEEEEELEAAKQRLIAQQGQRLDETQREQQVGLLHLQQAPKVLTEEEEAQRKKDADRKEFERRHQLELERQMGIHQEQAERALSSLSSMSSLSALSSLVSSSSLAQDSSGSGAKGAQNIINNNKEEEEARGA